MKHASPSRHIAEAALAGFDDGIDLCSRAIERCEPRLALSASLMGACLAPLADPFSIDSTFDLPLEPAVLQPAFDTPPLNELDNVFAQSTLNSSGNGHSLLEQSARVGASTGFLGSGQTIAVIDTGIAYDHHAFGSGFGTGQRVVGGWDFAESDADPYDDAPAGYHGSHVAGLASGMTTTINGDTFRGVAPGADLVALRVFNDFGNSSLAWIEQALRWVHDNQDAFESPITTVNMSLGTQLTDANRSGAMAMLEDELQMLFEDDILVFAASGNSQATLDPAADDLMYPASSRWVSAVGSVDSYGNLSGFSQRADGIFAAEGQQLLSSVPEHVRGYDGYVNDYTSLSGTSMASPQVAAASMLVREAMQAAGLDASSSSILERLESTASTHTDPSTGIVYRTLDLEAAVAFTSLPGGSGEQTGGGAGGAGNTPTTINQYLGTQASERIELDLRDLIGHDVSNSPSGFSGEAWLNIGETRFRLGAGSSTSEPIVIDAGAGGDTLEIFGSTGTEQLSLRPTTGVNGGNSQLVFAGGVIELRGFESVSFVGGGGEDRATLYDSGGDDELRSADNAISLSGRGFDFSLHDVDKAYVYANAGGNDTAHLSDTASDDQLVIRPQFSSLRGGDQFRAAFGFERVFAYAVAGGHDTADLGDSSGNDVMSIAAERSLISGMGYRASATGFESVVASASHGGDDTVRIYVDDPDGTWHSSPSMTQWVGADGTSRIARGFERSEAFELFETVAVHSRSLDWQPNAATDLVAQSADAFKRDAEKHLHDLWRLFEEYAG